MGPSIRRACRARQSSAFALLPLGRRIDAADVHAADKRRRGRRRPAACGGPAGAATSDRVAQRIDRIELQQRNAGRLQHLEILRRRAPRAPAIEDHVDAHAFGALAQQQFGERVSRARRSRRCSSRYSRDRAPERSHRTSPRAWPAHRSGSLRGCPASAIARWPVRDGAHGAARVNREATTARATHRAARAAAALASVPVVGAGVLRSGPPSTLRPPANHFDLSLRGAGRAVREALSASPGRRVSLAASPSPSPCTAVSRSSVCFSSSSDAGASWLSVAVSRRRVRRCRHHSAPTRSRRAVRPRVTGCVFDSGGMRSGCSDGSRVTRSVPALRISVFGFFGAMSRSMACHAQALLRAKGRATTSPSRS